ncbi:hypothetical protein [Verrucomicrobium spinosum]|uniref:hypothetical protein n=1 Tax=Verrucomicrobium spinosum TaxID=2736 RepID=UPI000AB4EE92|nr:hypothetical protein [Verrucomicrobium spinosum]
MTATLTREDLFDAHFLDRLRTLALRLRKRRQLMRRGMQSSPATGYTREFKDYRHYTPKEDFRAIDWRCTPGWTSSLSVFMRRCRSCTSTSWWTPAPPWRSPSSKNADSRSASPLPWPI